MCSESDDHGGLFRGGSFAGCAPEGLRGPLSLRVQYRAILEVPHCNYSTVGAITRIKAPILGVWGLEFGGLRLRVWGFSGRVRKGVQD